MVIEETDSGGDAVLQVGRNIVNQLSRKLVRDSRTKMIPSTSTAVSAIFHGSLIPAFAIGMHTENAKYAFEPIPEAKATG